METILFLAHTEADGSLAKAALEALRGGAGALRRRCDRRAGRRGDRSAAADQIADCGAARFLAVAGEAFAQSRYATDAAAAEALCRASGAAIVIAPSTSRWARALPGVAHAGWAAAWIRTPPAIASERRPGGDALVLPPAHGSGADARRSGRGSSCWSRAACAPWNGARGRGGGRSRRGGTARDPHQVTGVQAPPADEQTIRPDAKLLFVAGAGWTKKQADGAATRTRPRQLILGFLRAAKASLGGSKSLVDLSGEGQAVLHS